MGRAAADLHRLRGATIAILDLPESGGEQIAADIGRGTSFRPCDITDDINVENALANAVAELGGLDVAINTAGRGIAKRTLSASYMSSDSNEDEEQGVIINTSSIAAFEGQIGQSEGGSPRGDANLLTIVRRPSCHL